MFQLGTILHSKGFSITVVHTQFNSPNPSNNPDFKFQAIPDGLSDDDIASGNFVDKIALLNVNCEAPFQECLAQMVKQQDPGDEIVCVIYDELMFFSESAANQLKLKSIILRTTSATTGISRVALLRLKAEGFIPLQDPIMQDPVPRLHPFRFKDLPISKFGITENYLQLIINAYNTRTSSAVIWNTMDCLEQSLLAQIQQQYQVPIFQIGPLHKFAPASSSSLLMEDSNCITWLNRQAPDSVIYVSLGSAASIDKKELVEMAWGLANSKQPFLWVVRPGSVNGSEEIELWPEGFKETVKGTGCIVKWAPQMEVLSHDAVGGFWTHCGWNSTLESISEGVPMICRPCFGDQRVNAMYDQVSETVIAKGPKCGYLRILPLVDTPQELNVKYCQDIGDLLPGPSSYRQFVGGLVYLTITWADISYAINLMSQFMTAPRHLHLVAVKRIICYFLDTPTRGLFFPFGNSLSHVGYSDSD
ncbi:hypothetical protein EZV62_002763 [Acer yangbiense]|uniref:Glycosyltransferase n=1 Tax=Acer yangbiense TaxID=1000413 RepID=A0A5C7IZ61_9ROSI|nr:hypothetical protein EZV62_002763 [Acer yangbiense]